MYTTKLVVLIHYYIDIKNIKFILVFKYNG